eukprot:1684191-Rhodomonas_salina.1
MRGEESKGQSVSCICCRTRFQNVDVRRAQRLPAARSHPDASLAADTRSPTPDQAGIPLATCSPHRQHSNAVMISRTCLRTRGRLRTCILAALIMSTSGRKVREAPEGELLERREGGDG